MPGGLQQQAVLRVHGRRLIGRDGEEARVEAIDFLDKAGLGGIALAGGLGIGIEQGRLVPALGRHGRQRIAPRLQQGPVAVQIVHAAGKAAGRANDGNVFVAGERHAGTFSCGARAAGCGKAARCEASRAGDG